VTDPEWPGARRGTGCRRPSRLPRTCRAHHERGDDHVEAGGVENEVLDGGPHLCGPGGDRRYVGCAYAPPRTLQPRHPPDSRPAS
jgi:hypothetical protein